MGNADQVLMKEYKNLSKEPWTHIELVNENIREWEVALIVLNPDSLYYGGYFKARMSFKEDYPYMPPDFRFLRPLYHPNVYPDGRLCISILHAPGEDAMSGELASERWSPVQNVESVLISVLSLLDDAEVSSPANIDAGKDLRNDKARYTALVRRDLELSKQDIPPGFVMPTHEDAFKQPSTEEEYMMSWEDSDAEDCTSDWEMSEEDEDEGEEEAEGAGGASADGDDEDDTAVDGDADDAQSDAGGAEHRDRHGGRDEGAAEDL